jgi:hypothetical protein
MVGFPLTPFSSCFFIEGGDSQWDGKEKAFKVKNDKMESFGTVSE